MLAASHRQDHSIDPEVKAPQFVGLMGPLTRECDFGVASNPDLFRFIQPGLIAPTHVQRKFFINLLSERWKGLHPSEVVGEFDRYLSNIPEDVLTPPDPSLTSWNVSRACFNYCASLMRVLQNYTVEIGKLSPEESRGKDLAPYLIEAGFFQTISNPALFDPDNSREILSSLASDRGRIRSWDWQGSEGIIDANLQSQFPGIHSPDFYELIFLARVGTTINNFSCQRLFGAQMRIFSPAVKDMLVQTLGRSPDLTPSGEELVGREKSISGLANTLGDLLSSGRSTFRGAGLSSLLLNCSMDLKNIPASWRRA
jgi:hypothetical protein